MINVFCCLLFCQFLVDRQLKQMELFLYPTITLVFPQNKVFFIFIFFYFFSMGPQTGNKKGTVSCETIPQFCPVLSRAPLGPLLCRCSGGCSPPMLLLLSYVKYLLLIQAHQQAYKASYAAPLTNPLTQQGEQVKDRMCPLMRTGYHYPLAHSIGCRIPLPSGTSHQ